MEDVVISEVEAGLGTDGPRAAPASSNRAPASAAIPAASTIRRHARGRV